MSACGCAGSAMRTNLTFPFHVALVPSQVTVTDPVPVEEELGLRLVLSGAELDESLRSAMDGERFTRVTLLEYPEDLAGFQELSPLQRNRYWLDRANAVQADMLMMTSLRHDSRIQGERNEKFWLNIPVYLLTGPVSFFVTDRDYAADASLTVRLIDLTTIAVSKREQSQAELLVASVEFTDTELNLFDRAGSSVGPYLMAILIPPGLLSRSGKRVEREVATAATAALAEQLSALLGGRNEINSGRSLASFELDLPRCSVTRGAGGTVVLEIPLLLHTGCLGLRSYVIEADGQPPIASDDLEGAKLVDERVWIRHEWQLPAKITTIRLRVTDADTRARRYTFAIRERKEPER